LPETSSRRSGELRATLENRGNPFAGRIRPVKSAAVLNLGKSGYDAPLPPK
jgi:hypothetical protein